MAAVNTAFTPQHYISDPDTETVLFDGSFLKNGMVVMVGSPVLRVNVDTPYPMSPDEMGRALQYNRWAKVSHLNGFAYLPSGHKMVEFLATYEDGTQMEFHIAQSYSWIVKKSSVEVQESRRELVKAILRGELIKGLHLTDRELGIVEDEIVHRIVDLYEN